MTPPRKDPLSKPLRDPLPHGIAKRLMKGNRRRPADVARLDAMIPPEMHDVFFEQWMKHFSPSDTSVERFLSLFEIDTDEDDDDEGVKHVQFVPRKLQRKLLRHITRQRWKGRDGNKPGAARVMCLKGRRYGMTTFFILFGLERVLRIPGYNVTLVAQDDKMARKHFGRVRSFFRQIPEWVLNALDIVIVKDTDNEIVLRHGEYQQSTFDVAPAKRGALGRGDRVNMLILTEFPQWPNSAKEDLTGILKTCNRAVGNVTIFESTARGFEEFYQRCKRAWERKSDYHFFFVPAYEHPNSYIEFESEEKREEFFKGLGDDREFGGEEEISLYRLLIGPECHWSRKRALEHLNFRRSEIMSEYGGHLPYYHREQPNTPEEAFEGSGRPVFDVTRINGWLPIAEAWESKHGVRGRLRRVPDGVKFVEDRQGSWTILKKPDPLRPYCFGSDVASGAEKINDSYKEADYSTNKIKDVLTGDTVAHFRAHIDPRLLAEEILLAALYYRMTHEPMEGPAEGHVEVNNDGGRTVDTLEDIEHGGVSGFDILMTRQVFERSDAGRKVSYAVGFRTTSKTKHNVVGAVRDFLAEIGTPDPERYPPINAVTLKEMLRFQVPDKGGAGEASTGFDDCVIDEGLTLLARQTRMVDLPTKSWVPTRGPEVGSPWAAIASMERDRNKPQADEMLGSAF